MNGKIARFALFLLMLVSLFAVSSAPAQTAGKRFTLVYSNNINGEIEPCPT